MRCLGVFFDLSIKLITSVFSAPLLADDFVSFCFNLEILGCLFQMPTTDEMPNSEIIHSMASLSSTRNTLHGHRTDALAVDKSLSLKHEKVLTFIA